MKSILEQMCERVRTTLDDESGERRVGVNDMSDKGEGQPWVNFTVHYKNQADGEEQITFVVYWISEHIWSCNVMQSCGEWTTTMEADPLAMFYMAVGFAYLHFDGPKARKE